MLDASLYDKFSTSSLVATIDEGSIGSSNLTSFDCITILTNKTVLYYVTDSSGVFIYEEDWKFKFKINLTLSGYSYIKQVNNELFISYWNRLIKTNLNLKIIKETTRSPYFYPRGITHDNSCNDWILHAIWGNFSYANKIDVYNRNLILVDSILVDPYQPYSVLYYENKIFVGTLTNGNVLVIQNKSISQVWTTPCAGLIASINIDQYGYIMISCFYQHKIFLLYKNGTSTGKSLNTTYSPSFVSVDQKGRIIVNGNGKLQLFF